jgi:DNA-binding CsgD family transcriptional regulator
MGRWPSCARRRASTRPTSSRCPPLGPGEIRQIVGGRGRRAVTARDLDRVVEVAGGNPFLAEEIAEFLQRHGSAPLGDPLPLPETVTGLLGERIGALPAGARPVLLAAAPAPRPARRQPLGESGGAAVRRPARRGARRPGGCRRPGRPGSCGARGRADPVRAGAGALDTRRDPPPQQGEAGSPGLTTAGGRHLQRTRRGRMGTSCGGTARTRRGPASAASDLTEAESQAVALVRQGLTNREVASRLFISEKTVEGTLTRAYRKLGVRRRAELFASPGAPPELDRDIPLSTRSPPP